MLSAGTNTGRKKKRMKKRNSNSRSRDALGKLQAHTDVPAYVPVPQCQSIKQNPNLSLANLQMAVLLDGKTSPSPSVTLRKSMSKIVGPQWLT